MKLAACLSLATILTLSLIGCGTGPASDVSTTSIALSGRIMGGQQPVSSSSIQLYAAGSTGYGSASTAMLSGVMSDSGGGFVLPGYTCPSSTTQMYLVARGGNPGLSGTVNNTALTLMAALGPCGSLSAATHVIINEVTTVAAVWALAPFMTAYDHVGTSASNATGLVNAFSTAATLASVDRGQSPGDAPAGTVIPQAEIYTVANILASCVNSAGGTAGDSSACGNLFTVTTPSGGSAATETVGAALAIAQHPGANGSLFGSSSSLYGLVTSTGPFQPTLNTAPNDWTVTVTYPLPGVALDIAMDANGNLFAVNTTALYELGPTGTLLATVSAMANRYVALDAGGNIWTLGPGNLEKIAPTLSSPAKLTFEGFSPIALAIDGSGNAWFGSNYGTDTVLKVSPALAQLGSYHSSITRQSGMSIDVGGNVWLGNVTSGRIGELTNSGALAPGAPYSCGSCSGAASIANDASSNAWSAYGATITRMTSSGSYTNFGSFGNWVGGAYSPLGTAIDGAGNAWFISSSCISNAYQGALSELSNSGAALSPYLGFVSGSFAQPQGIAIDGSGNVWVRNTQTNIGTPGAPVYQPAPSVSVTVGVATPVVTPLAKGLANGTLATAP